MSAGRIFGNALLVTFQFLHSMLEELFDSSDGRKTKKPKLYDPNVLMKMRKGLSNETKQKPNTDCLKTWIRILSESDDALRRTLYVKRIAGAYRELDADNQLIRKDVPDKEIEKFVETVGSRKAPAIKISRNVMSIKEVGKLQMLPTSELQKEYKQIGAIHQPEVSLPNELFMQKVKGINIGLVTEKGVTRMARFPVEAYEDIAKKYVLDAYCLAEFSFGEQGSGKTGEAIHKAHSAICLGQTVFFFDTADGQAARELHDSLPSNYPEDKIIHLDLTNKAWPVGLTWAFSPDAKNATEDDELKAEEARETAKMFLRQFVNGMSSADFTNRMDRYLSACARAAGASPLNIELALISPSYRQELLEMEHVQNQPDILLELQALQEKAKRGADDVSVDGILSRLRMLSSDRFRTNLFYQTPITPLEFRKYADNKEGGFGYCVTIYCDKNSYGPDGQEAILTYLLAKVLLEGAYSRVDIPQCERTPFLVILDEPHRFIKGEMATKLGEDAAVELRKYRCKLSLMNHSREQLGKLWDAFESGGIQVTMYKSKNVKAFKDMAPLLAPLDPEEAWASLGKHEAIVTRKLPSKKEVAFICKMAPPPKQVKDRSKRREECAKQFGRSWKEVAQEIQAKRMEYTEKDQKWLEQFEKKNKK